MNTTKVDAFLTLSQAATIAGRSYSWARDRAADGRFDARRFSANGQIFVTSASLEAVMGAERRRERARPPIERSARSHLRLVWDRDKTQMGSSLHKVK